MNDEQRIWQLLEETGVGMLTTRFAGGMRARPLDARPDSEASAIFFIIDVRGLKDDEIVDCADVCFTLTNAVEKAYVSITGRAQVLDDHALAAKFWKKADDIWWPDGPNERNVRVLRLDPHIGEMWDGPASAVVVRHEFAKARATGEKPDLGEKRKVKVTM
jgi:general stress protein 26